MKNGDLPAYPLPREISETLPNTGLTKREYFAAMAMQGLLANKRYGKHYKTEEVVESSLIIADEILDQLEL